MPTIITRLAPPSAVTQASTCSRVRLRTVSSTFAWSAASEASNSEWSKSNSGAVEVPVLGRPAAAVLLDRGLLKLGVALEAERLREADDGRRRGVGAAGELLGGLEGGLVEVVDDVAGDVLLRARELVEAFGDVGRERLAVRAGRPAGGCRSAGASGCGRRGGTWWRSWSRPVDSPHPAAFPFADARVQERPRCGWIGRDGRRGAAAPDQPQHGRLRPGARLGRAARARRDPAGARPRRALARRPRAVSPLRPDLAHLRRGAPGGRPPRPARGLVGARLAARHRARHRHRLVALGVPSRARAPAPGMWFAGAANLAMAAGFAWLARERSSRPSGLRGLLSRYW